MKKWFYLLLLCSCAHEPERPQMLPYVRVTKPIVCEAPIYIEYVGHVEPNLSVDIRPQVDGVITGQYFVEGQEVCENSLLLTLDPRPFQAELEKAQGVLAQNLASLQQARETANRYKELARLNYISQLDYDKILTEVLTQEALVHESKAAVDEAEIRLSYCTIQAPFKGVTSKLKTSLGNYVSSADQTTLLTLNQISPIRVSFYVPEKDLSKIAPLQLRGPLAVQVKREDDWIQGKLFLINNKVDEKTGTLLLQAIFENQDWKLWPGEFVEVRLILKVEEKAILVPASAVQIGQNGSFVYVLKSDYTVEMRSVKVGQKEEDNRVIESGIKEDETIVTEGQLNLVDGAKALVKP